MDKIREDCLERKHERQDWCGMDMYEVKMIGTKIARRMLRMELPGNIEEKA